MQTFFLFPLEKNFVLLKFTLANPATLSRNTSIRCICVPNKLLPLATHVLRFVTTIEHPFIENT